MKINQLIASLESAPVGDGDLLGEPFKVLPYQKKSIRDGFRPGVIRAGLSLARGGGKSGLASALCLDAVRPEGVLHRPGFEAVLIASSFAQAKIVFDAVRNLPLILSRRASAVSKDGKRKHSSLNRLSPPPCANLVPFDRLRMRKVGSGACPERSRGAATQDEAVRFCSSFRCRSRLRRKGSTESILPLFFIF